MSSESVTTSVADGVATVKLSEPESRNALSGAMLAGLQAALAELHSDPSVGSVVLTGSGGHFASGANLRELRETSPGAYLTGPRGDAWAAVRDFPKPLVAAVAGFALGGGCELALSCDVVIAGDRSVFGQPEVQVGLVPGAGGTQRWARTCGPYEAATIVLAGRTVSVWEGRRMGLVQRVVPEACVVQAAEDVARTFLSSAPLAVRHAKRALRLSQELPLGAALEQERTLLATLLASEDLQEGVSAFLEKRTPIFRGR